MALGFGLPNIQAFEKTADLLEILALAADPEKKKAAVAEIRAEIDGLVKQAKALEAATQENLESIAALKGAEDAGLTAAGEERKARAEAVKARADADARLKTVKEEQDGLDVREVKFDADMNKRQAAFDEKNEAKTSEISKREKLVEEKERSIDELHEAARKDREAAQARLRAIENIGKGNFTAGE